MNNELDIVEEKRQFYEDENHQLKDELQICQNRRITSENEVDRLRLEVSSTPVKQTKKSALKILFLVPINNTDTFDWPSTIASRYVNNCSWFSTASTIKND